MKREIESNIVIQSSPQIIWEHLVNFDLYKEWNPFILLLRGNLIEGSKINVKIKPKDSQEFDFKPTVIKVEEHKEIRWRGYFLMKGLFDGEHYFKLIDNGDNTTTFIQGEIFSGILVSFMKKMIDINTLGGFKQMNMQLKKRIETTKPE